jgi:hypothetical protein
VLPLLPPCCSPRDRSRPSQRTHLPTYITHLFSFPFSSRQTPAQKNTLQIVARWSTSGSRSGMHLVFNRVGERRNRSCAFSIERDSGTGELGITGVKGEGHRADRRREDNGRGIQTDLTITNQRQNHSPLELQDENDRFIQQHLPTTLRQPRSPETLDEEKHTIWSTSP